MCGIVGYVGAQQAAPLLLEGLGRLEHRGYDSAGVALVNGGRTPVFVPDMPTVSTSSAPIGWRMRLSAATASVHSGDGSRDARGARTGTEGTSPGGGNNLEQDRRPVTRVAAVLAHV